MPKTDPFAGVRWIWMNGEAVDFREAKIHVLSHGLHYGSGAFEGIRCYSTPKGPAVFRLDEHLQRLEDSCKIFRMEVPFSQLEIREAVFEMIERNELEACYIRPLVYRGFGSMGVLPFDCPVEVMVAVWPWGAYLGDEALAQGVDVCVSSWRRAAPDTFPSLAKLTGNYVSSQLIKMEAVANGFAEGIALDPAGLVSEGSGENVFLVQNGRLLTAPRSRSILPGITRDTIFTLAKDLGIEVVEEQIPREQLYICDEIFFTGTAAEVTPVRSVDKIPVGDGKPGPVTQRLMDAYLDLVKGRVPDRYGWLSPAQVEAMA